MQNTQTSRWLKKPLALLLVLVMVLSIMPVFEINARAAGEQLNVGVSGWSGGDWNTSSNDQGSKALNISWSGLDLNKDYIIHIALKQPFIFTMAPRANGNWNGTNIDELLPAEYSYKNAAGNTNRWFTWTQGMNWVNVDQLGIDQFIDGMDIYYDDNGTSADISDDYRILDYHIASGNTASTCLTDRLAIRPHQVIAYDGDKVTDFLKVELYEVGASGNTPVKTSAAGDVTIRETDPIGVWSDWNSWKELRGGSHVAGAKNVKILRNTGPENYYGMNLRSGFVKKMKQVLTLPYVSKVSSVKFYNEKTGTQNEELPNTYWTWDATTHTFTVEVDKFYELTKPNTFDYSIFGDIADGITEGQYDNGLSIQATMYDGTVLTESDYLVYTHEKTTIGANTNDLTVNNSTNSSSYLSNNPTNDRGTVDVLASVLFKANGAVDQDQVVKFDFGPEVEVKGVTFPLDTTLTSELKDLKVTLSNNQTYTYSTWATETHYGYNAPSQHAYVNVGALHDKNSFLSENLYITSIEANCGKFSADYVTSANNGNLGGCITGNFKASAVDPDPTKNTESAFTVTVGPVNSTTPKTTNLKFYLRGEKNRAGYSALAFGGPASIAQGESGSVIFAANFGGGLRGVIEEQVIQVVLPTGVSLENVTAKFWTERPCTYNIDGQTYTTTDNGSGGVNAADIPQSLVHADPLATPITYNGEQYTVYKLWADKTRLTTIDSAGRYMPRTRVYFYGDLCFDDNYPTGNFDLGKLTFLGRPDFAATQYSSSNNNPDVFDLNGNGDTTEMNAFVSNGRNIFVSNAETVSAFVTLSKDAAMSEPVGNHNAGTNGNVVALKPGANVYYNVTIRNTFKNASGTYAAKTYIPIPSGTFDSNAVFTSLTDPASDAQYDHYQYKAYNWPMKLAGAPTLKVGDATTNPFQFVYYTGKVTLDANGVPTTAGSTTAPADLSTVTMIGIVSTKNIPIQDEWTFQLPLTVNVTDAQVDQNQRLNNAMNEFRVRIFRQTPDGDGYKDSGWVAARLAMATISGIAFNDVDGDGKYTAGTDTTRDGVTVELLQGTNLLDTKTTAGGGKYAFNGLANANNYVVRFTLPGATSDVRFTKQIAYDATSGYMTDSDAVVTDAATQTVASTKNIVLPNPGNVGGEHNSRIYVGFIAKGTLTVEVGDTSKGTIKVNGTAITADQTIPNVWPGTDTSSFNITTEGKNGYEFDKWTFTRTGSTAAEDFKMGDPLPGTGTLTANWKASNQTLTLDTQGGTIPSGGASSFQIATGAKMNSFLTASNYKAPTKQYYTFGGWFTDSACTKALTDADLMPAGGATVYAKWNDNFYTVKFNANNGTGTAMADQKIEIGVSTKLTKNSYSRTGHTFDGWATTATGTRAYTDEQAVTNLARAGETITLYAVWKGNEFNITWDYAGGTVTPANPTKANAGTTVTFKAPTKTNYTLTGWTADPSTLTVAANATTFTMPASNVKLTAQWTRDTYKVHFDANNAAATGTMADQTINRGEATALTAIGFSVPGHTFKGWATSATGGVVYGDKASVNNIANANATITLYAVWEANSHAINYELDNGTNAATNPMTAKYGDTVTLADPTRQYYEFTGWTTVSPTSLVWKTAKSFEMPDEDVTVKATWKALQYTVTFNGNGATGGGMAPQTITIGVPTALTRNGFSKTGYVFEGWSETANGAVQYQDGETVDFTGDKILYAVWKLEDFIGGGSDGNGPDGIADMYEVVVYYNVDGNHGTCTPSYETFYQPNGSGY
ncbi:MAG: InlB B-repeat-containing protein, partial [Oscillospiraceae bacterium]|nr:InlB B-repeat-containing protein [Oscillospiraceae bacterium]